MAQPATAIPKIILEPAREIPVLLRGDVVVAGGGVAGAMAAVAAARNGARTILVEKYGFLGGMATAAWVAPMMTFHNRRGQVIIGGLPQEVIDRMQAKGGAIGHVPDTIGVAYSITPNNPEILKLALMEMLDEAGVETLFHTWISEPLLEGDRITGIVVENKKGRQAILGSAFIDCTGDADVAVAAGVPYESGRRPDGLNQPMTLMFRVGNVDRARLVAYMQAHHEEFHDTTDFAHVGSAPVIGVSGFFHLWKEARLPIQRDRLLMFSTLVPGEFLVNTVRVSGLDGTDPLQLSKAEIEGRRQMWLLFQFLRDKVPGFEDAILVGAASQIGVRETRRVVGEYVLTGEDVIEGRRFPDSIAQGGFPTDIHSPDGRGIEHKEVGGNGAYQIPFRSLVPLKIANLLVAGRCFSSTFEGHSSARLQPTCMAMGQAAGTAAAMAAAQNIPVRNVDVGALQAVLIAQGAIL